MSSLTAGERRYFEKLFGMASGYVLDFTDRTFGQLFNSHAIDIHGDVYKVEGTSKAWKLRSFWEQEPDTLVGEVLAELLDTYEANCKIGGTSIDVDSLQECRDIVARLMGKTNEPEFSDDDKFLVQEFEIPSLDKLPVDFIYAEIIQGRITEAQTCMRAGAHLSAIFLCGSVLEAVLLGAAQREPEKFNRSKASPRVDNKVKRFTDWKLSEFIDVGQDIGILKLDVQKFSHGLRDFRNYIHPYEQAASGFNPDEYTAKVCYQVLKAALASVAGDR